jgi:tRNA(Ser,Leu) C12 N-acetylase TAN1
MNIFIKKLLCKRLVFLYECGWELIIGNLMLTSKSNNKNTRQNRVTNEIWRIFYLYADLCMYVTWYLTANCSPAFFIHHNIMADRRDRKRGLEGSTWNSKYSGGGRGGGKTKTKSNSNPKRGGPAMLLSCETGLERKCLRDGLDILRHYYKLMYTSPSDHDSGNGQPLTIDQEIQLLKDGSSVDFVLDTDTSKNMSHEQFQMYDSGCRGTVLIMFVAQESQRDAMGKKKTMVADEAWDPIHTVSTIMQHLKYPASCIQEPPPRSRFIVRMLPLQATCFTSMEEIQAQITTLLQTHLIPEALKTHQLRQSNTQLQLPTFKVEFRRRHCSNITREQIIDYVILTISKLLQQMVVDDDTNKDPQDETTIIDQYFTVDLEKPDFTVLVEICRNVCGMSIIKQAYTFQNFNLIEAGTTSAA